VGNHEYRGWVEDSLILRGIVHISFVIHDLVQK